MVVSLRGVLQLIILTASIGIFSSGRSYSQSLVPLDPNADHHSPETHFPIGLQCPQGASGTLEFLTAKRTGVKAKLSVTYISGRATVFSIDIALAGKEWTRVLDSRSSVGSAQFMSEKAIGNSKIQADALLNQICLSGPTVESRYHAMTRLNRELLHAAHRGLN